MADFIKNIQRLRIELREKLDELDAAERVYREIGAQATSHRDQRNSSKQLSPRVTIKEMVLSVLSEAHPKGLRLSGILFLVRLQYQSQTKCDSLSSQMTRLKNDRLVFRENGVWKITKVNVTRESEASQASSATPECL